MPRTFRPGARPNRTDMLTPAPPSPVEAPGQPNGQPVMVPTGLPYGEAQQLAGAQQAVPVPGSPPVGAAPTPAGGPPTGTPGYPFGADGSLHPDVAAGIAQLPRPTLGLGAPSQFPNEPVTAGLPSGPGPGPAAPFGGGAPNVLVQAQAIIHSLGSGVSGATAQIRDQIDAALGNQGSP